MNRREVIVLLGAAAAWPVASRAQRGTAPVIGYLNPGSPEAFAPLVSAFRKGLTETDYVEGRNVAIEFRWANNEYDRLPELAADLARRRVAVIAAIGNPITTLAAKEATTTIPIVFVTGGNPVDTGLVASLNRPGSNVTGVTGMSAELAGKQLGLLHEMVPRATRFAVLFNPESPSTASFLTDVKAAASAMGLQLEPLAASTI